MGFQSQACHQWMPSLVTKGAIMTREFLEPFLLAAAAAIAVFAIFGPIFLH